MTSRRAGDIVSSRTNDHAQVFLGTTVVRPRQQVEDRIRQAILGGELQRGDRLPPEAELARQFGVSRTTVREALRALSTQNLIQKLPGAGGGSFVRAVDHEALADVVSESLKNLLGLGSIEPIEVNSVREYLELPAVRLAADHRTEEDLQKMRDVIEQQKSISVDDPQVPELDVAFHTAIAQASDNRVLASFVWALHEQLKPVHFLALSPEVGATSVQQHVKIVRALETHDSDAAAQAMRQHLDYLREHTQYASSH